MAFSSLKASMPMSIVLSNTILLYHIV